jgi:hypothetical protein
MLSSTAGPTDTLSSESSFDLALAVSGILVGVFGLILLVVVASGLSMRPEKTILVSPERIVGRSIKRYRPMLWLLSDKRLRHLRFHGGVLREFRIRARRSQIFGRLLKSLRADFGRTCNALKLVMVHSPHDRPDLASVLLRATLVFSCRVVIVQFRLWRYRWGLR